MGILNKTSTRAPKGFDKEKTKEDTVVLKQQLVSLQDLLYAEHKHAILVIIQGMDASGKDGAIKNVFGGLNPQGVLVKSFKAPSDDELSHDFLWRIHQHVPAKGILQIFNRSQYEDVLITRVHGWCDAETAEKRFKAINDFEALLQDDNNTRVLKFYLHISPEEQKERLQERMDNPTKGWKYNAADFKEAKLWDTYQEMYEDVFKRCDKVPWIIVPADQNWYKEYLITKTVADAMQSLDMHYPPFKKEGE